MIRAARCRSRSDDQPCPPVRLGRSRCSIFQYLEASVNSASTSCPLGNSASRPLSAADREADQAYVAERAHARSPLDAAHANSVHKILNSHGVDHGRRSGDADGFAQECGLFRVAFDQMDMRARRVRPARRRSPGRESRRRCRGRPRPWPSAPERRSCSESAMWRVQSCGIVEAAIEIGLGLPLSSSSTKRSSRAACFT